MRGARASTKPVQVVYGPGTFINSAVGEIQSQLADALAGDGGAGREGGRRGRASCRAGAGSSQGRSRTRRAESARQVVYAKLLRDLLQINLRYGLGLTGVPTLNDPNFVSALVFDPARGARDAEGALRLPVPERATSAVDPGAAEAGPHRGRSARDAIAQIRARGRDAASGSSTRRSYTVTGAPVVLEDLADALAGSVLRLLVVALVVMALVLALVFRSRLRLVPLLVALAAVAVTFGAMARGRRAADDGLDRGAARAARARRRLRDPVPGARRGGGRRRVARGAAGRCRRSPPRRSPPASASSCCSSRRCRWCAGSARCWWSASCSRCCSR